MLNIEELKAEIERKTGIPAALISGTNSEEVFSYAKQLAAFKGARRETEAPAAPASPRDQFAEVARATGLFGEQETEPENGMLQAVNLLESEMTRQYPNIMDAGEAHITVHREPRDSFAEWFGSFFAFDPRKY